MPPPFRERLWAPVPLCPIARVSALQVLAFVLVFAKTEPGTFGRLAIVIGFAIGVATLPLSRLLSALLGPLPRAYCWPGRVWVASVHIVFATTVGGAYDGTGPSLAERICTPFGLAATVGLCFGAGAHGALLSVPREVAAQMGIALLPIAAIKLHVAYTHAYLAMHVVVFGSLALGYTCVSKYADVHEALREAAEEIVVGAAAREPFVVTDAGLNIRAVNQRLLHVFGYEEHELVGKPVMELLDEASSFDADHAWIRRTLFEAASRKENPDGHVWSVRTKQGQAHPVRITLGETRCPTNGAKMFTAQFSCMKLEQRNHQLCAEKEKLQWEVASHHDGEEDPRELLGATVFEVKLECRDCGLGECNDHCPLFNKDPHRTLGAMQDQQTTDAAVSCANSFDHVASSASPTLPKSALVAPAPPKTPSSCLSLQSSVTDTISEAAKKSPTRAPPPPKKKSRLPRPKKVCSEPSAGANKPKAGNPKKPKRAVLGIERVAGMFEGA